MEAGILALVAITLAAAFVNGALGYGFSSLTVPVGLVFFANRVLNPALVLIEVFINLYVLVINRAAIRAVWHRVWPIMAGLLPGVALGSYLLASLHPDWLKLGTYLLILPLILVAESCLTAFAYAQLGLFPAEALHVGSWIVPSVLAGIPLGALAIRRMDAETFRRICMSFDVWVVGFGLSRSLVALKLATSP